MSNELTQYMQPGAPVHLRSSSISPSSCAPLLQGTGIVTSVPSDAPDDYAALMDLGELASLVGLFERRLYGQQDARLGGNTNVQLARH